MSVDRIATSSRWRKRARKVIQEVIAAQRALGVPDDSPTMRLWIRDAYPFGERKYTPYRAWLIEQRIAIAALLQEDTMPTPDEAAACEVARDLFEDGRLDEMNTLLDEQAPHRLNPKCPACSAPAGQECRDLSDMSLGTAHAADVLLVPHASRLLGDSGPLFRGSM